MKKQDGIRIGEVTYLTLDKMRDHKLETSELPFLKRSPFQDEKEFRVIYEHALRVVITSTSRFICPASRVLP